MRCAFCKADQLVQLCSRIVDVLTPTRIGNFKRGDVMKSGQFGASWEFVSVAPADVPGMKAGTFVEATFAALDTGKIFKQLIGADDRYNKADRQPCGKPVCERHQRELGPQHVICVDHWNSWADPPPRIHLDHRGSDKKKRELEAELAALDPLDVRLGGYVNGR